MRSRFVGKEFSHGSLFDCMHYYVTMTDGCTCCIYATVDCTKCKFWLSFCAMAFSETRILILYHCSREIGLERSCDMIFFLVNFVVRIDRTFRSASKSRTFAPRLSWEKQTKFYNSITLSHGAVTSYQMLLSHFLLVTTFPFFLSAHFIVIFHGECWETL